jgi:hypothetical protein
VAVVLLVLLTVLLMSFLVAFKPPLPQARSSLYYSVQTGLTAPTWGDGTDCANISNPQSCSVLPAIDIVFTTQSPGTMPVTSLEFYFFCNGTIYLQSSFPNIEYVPSTSHGANFDCTGANANCLGVCGTFNPALDFNHGNPIPFNRLGYFWQIHPNATYLNDGDSIMLFLHKAGYPIDLKTGGADSDDYHGVPPWCFTVANACEIKIAYTGQPATTVLDIPVASLAS